MAIVIVSILLVCYALIATERLTRVNKSAVAVFAGTIGWMLYICFGTDFVLGDHRTDFLKWLGDAPASEAAIKMYISQSIFLKYVARACEVAFFVLATTMTVEILHTDGCFDSLSGLLRTRKSQRLLWSLVGVAFLVSANLDNLTTTILMLSILHVLVANTRQRMILGSAILIAVNCGGALTVIGNPATLELWNIGAVTATDYSLTLLVPCLLACVIPVFWLGRLLPDTVDLKSPGHVYRGDDSRLSKVQRMAMMVVAVGGLWFIPTFHSITKLSPFLGAFCVLSVIWVYHEIVNAGRDTTLTVTQQRTARLFQSGRTQLVLFIVGLMLAVGVVEETNVLHPLAELLYLDSAYVWVAGVLGGAVSVCLDNFATALTMFSLPGINSFENLSPSFVAAHGEYISNGIYWKVCSYVSAMGGNVLCIGSLSGIALMQAEQVSLGWFFRTVGWKALVGILAGLVWMAVMYYI